MKVEKSQNIDFAISSFLIPNQPILQLCRDKPKHSFSRFFYSQHWRQRPLVTATERRSN